MEEDCAPLTQPSKKSRAWPSPRRSRISKFREGHLPVVETQERIRLHRGKPPYPRLLPVIRNGFATGSGWLNIPFSRDQRKRASCFLQIVRRYSKPCLIAVLPDLTSGSPLFPNNGQVSFPCLKCWWLVMHAWLAAPSNDQQHRDPVCTSSDPLKKATDLPCSLRPEFCI